MLKFILSITLLTTFYYSANAQVLDSMSIKNRKLSALIQVTQQDVDEYVASRKITDTTGQLLRYISIIKIAKINLAYFPDRNYEQELDRSEQGEKLRDRLNFQPSQADLHEYLLIRKIKDDTTGKTKEYIQIIKNAKFRSAFDPNLTYENALIKAEEFLRLKNMVDKVLVIKSERKMYLLKNGKTVRTYTIGLGPHPVGQKQYEGDGKTPEGIYTLDWQKWNSSTLHSFHISYPNQQDIERAKQKGLTVGSNIMVHGTSKGIKKKKDWTNGCIALTNNDMMSFKEIVFQDTPIEIRK